MDLTSLMGALLSDNSISTVSEKSGVDAKDVASVMAAALPALLNGANAQANQKETAESFHEAVTEHAAKDPEKVDAEEGEKIVNHLLGAEEAAKTEKAIAKSTGLSKTKVILILAALAPLVMNMLGKQTTSSNSNSAASTASLLGSLLGGNAGSAASSALMGAALSSVLSSALGGSSKPQASSSSILGSVLSSALGANQKPSNASADILGSVLSSAMGASQTQQQANVGNDLLSGLIGSALTGGASQAKPSASNSTANLLNGLMGLLK